MKNYKVYALKERKSAIIVYIGLTGRSLNKRFNDHVHNKKFKPEDYYIELIQDDLTIEQATTLERLLIEQYDLLNTGWNKSPGSINGSSNQHSDAQKQKWSEERKGKEFKGRQNRTSKNTETHNKKISDVNSKKIICLNNGKVYDSQRKAAKELGLSEAKVSYVLNKKRPHTKGYIFSYL